ncbi:MAG: hypothetical protein PHX87_06080 [Candidatus Peribacteraceae bacterium]|nr:hypothetical protein [Candidatus Peribacteraceae bacterium]MDD5742958.1 hypothetical protein [Candidatus Peribacteraceae bacterium]
MLVSTSSETVARDTPTVSAVDTVSRMRKIETSQEAGSPAVVLRLLIADALHEHSLTQPEAVTCMKFVDAAEQRTLMDGQEEHTPAMRESRLSHCRSIVSGFVKKILMQVSPRSGKES